MEQRIQFRKLVCRSVVSTSEETSTDRMHVPRNPRADAAGIARSVSALRAEPLRSGVDGGQGGAAETRRRDEAAGRRAHGRDFLERLQDSEQV